MTYTLPAETYIDSLRIVFDSDLDRKTLKGGIQEIRDCPTVCNRPLDMKSYTFPSTMVKSFEILADGEVIHVVNDNCLRLVKLPVKRSVKKLSLRPVETYGDETAHVFSFDFK